MSAGTILTLDEAMKVLTEDVKKILQIHLISFGWTPVLGGSSSLPKANVYLDCRGIPNPHHTTLSHLGGDHPYVIEFVKNAGNHHHLFLSQIEEAITRLPVRRRDKEDPFVDPLIVACGCAWGVHRSVAMKYILAGMLQERGWNAVIK